MAELWSTATAWIITYAIHGTLILTVVAALVRLAPLREWVEESLWRFGLVAALATASLQIGLGHAAWRPIDVGATGGLALPSVAEVAEPDAVAPATAILRSGPRPGSTFAAPVASPAAPLRGELLIVPLAVAFAVIGLARLGLRRLALRRLLGDRRALIDGSDARVALDRLRRRAGLRQPVALSVSGALDSPVAFGIWRPEICVPRRALHDLSPAARDAMLAHELAHVMRRDPLVLEVAHSLAALFPWQPLLRTALRRLRTLAEYRSDAIAAALTDGVDVADCLVEVAGWLRGATRRVTVAEGLVGMAVQRDGLAARVDRLLAAESMTAPPPRLRHLAGGLLALAALSAALPGAGPSAAALRIAVVELPPPPAAPDPLVDLLAAVDGEREALGAELRALRAEAEQWLPAAELAPLLDALERRLASIDRKRAALASIFDVPPTVSHGSARTTLTPKLETIR